MMVLALFDRIWHNMILIDCFADIDGRNNDDSRVAVTAGDSNGTGAALQRARAERIDPDMVQLSLSLSISSCLSRVQLGDVSLRAYRCLKCH
jgi:hypothetical protein